MTERVENDLDQKPSTQVQGNIVRPFASRFQAFVLLHFNDQLATRRWIHLLLPRVSFGFSKRECPPTGRCFVDVGLSLTFAGIVLLEPRSERVFRVFRAFSQGAAARSAGLGDAEPTGPSGWLFGREDQGIHGILLLAANDSLELGSALDQQCSLARQHDIGVVQVHRGGDLPGDMCGREHFGFKDNVCQPLPNCGSVDRSPCLIRDLSTGLRATDSFRDARNKEDAVFLRDGVFQVFRRINQDVGLWRRQVADLAQRLEVSQDVSTGEVANMLMGVHPEVSGGVDCDAGYGNDPWGFRVPAFAHVRKMRPLGVLSVQDAEQHRMIRRGVPFGSVYDAAASTQEERGLLFNSYMGSIERQFEFLQRAWANHPDFPEADDGIDIVVGVGSRDYRIRLRDGGTCKFHFHRCVWTTGCIYAFVPGADCLNAIASHHS